MSNQKDLDLVEEIIEEPSRWQEILHNVAKVHHQNQKAKTRKCLIWHDESGSMSREDLETAVQKINS